MLQAPPEYTFPGSYFRWVLFGRLIRTVSDAEMKDQVILPDQKKLNFSVKLLNPRARLVLIPILSEVWKLENKISR